MNRQLKDKASNKNKFYCSTCEQEVLRFSKIECIICKNIFCKECAEKDKFASEVNKKKNLNFICNHCITSQNHQRKKVSSYQEPESIVQYINISNIQYPSNILDLDVLVLMKLNVECSLYLDY